MNTSMELFPLRRMKRALFLGWVLLVLVDCNEPDLSLDCHQKADASSKAQCCTDGLGGWLGGQALYKQKEAAESAFLTAPVQTDELKATRDLAITRYDVMIVILFVVVVAYSVHVEC
jgi:hypothetical protein